MEDKISSYTSVKTNLLEITNLMINLQVVFISSGVQRCTYDDVFLINKCETSVAMYYTNPLMSRIERKYCSASTLYMTELLAIFILYI